MGGQVFTSINGVQVGGGSSERFPSNLPLVGDLWRRIIFIVDRVTGRERKGRETEGERTESNPDKDMSEIQRQMWSDLNLTHLNLRGIQDGC